MLGDSVDLTCDRLPHAKGNHHDPDHGDWADDLHGRFVTWLERVRADALAAYTTLGNDRDRLVAEYAARRAPDDLAYEALASRPIARGTLAAEMLDRIAAETVTAGPPGSLAEQFALIDDLQRRLRQVRLLAEQLGDRSGPADRRPPLVDPETGAARSAASLPLSDRRIVEPVKRMLLEILDA